MIVFRVQNDNGDGCIYGKKMYKMPYELKYDRSYILPDGTERWQHPDADITISIFKPKF